MAEFHVCWEGLVGGGGGGCGEGGGRAGRLRRRKAEIGDFLLAQWGRALAPSDRLTRSDATFLCLHSSAVTHQHAHMRALENRCGTTGGGKGVWVCVWVVVIAGSLSLNAITLNFQ